LACSNIRRLTSYNVFKGGRTGQNTDILEINEKENLEFAVDEFQHLRNFSVFPKGEGFPIFMLYEALRAFETKAVLLSEWD
jgi:hypothetical protein